MFRIFQSKKRDDFHFPNLRANVLKARSFEHLKKAMGWTKDPVFTDASLNDFHFLEDLNDRRLRDAEVIGAACCNGHPKILLEIGTSHGRTTALMAQNAPDATVYTVNIPPEEIAEGGKNITFAPERDEIGKYYREMGLANIQQIIANTARWEPDFEPIDVALVDGAHDPDFVYNDTRKILGKCRQGSIIMWHDFNLELLPVYPWIRDVCEGIERLYDEGYLKGRIIHLQDSWTGLYRVERYF